MSKQEEIDKAMSLVQQERNGELPSEETTGQVDSPNQTLEGTEEGTEQGPTPRKAEPKHKEKVKAPSKHGNKIVMALVVAGLVAGAYLFKDQWLPLIDEFTKQSEPTKANFNCIGGDCGSNQLGSAKPNRGVVSQDVEYITKEEMRKFANNLRIQIANLEDQPEQSDDLLRAFDTISSMELALQDQMTANEILIDRFEELEAKLSSGTDSDVTAIRDQLTALQNDSGELLKAVDELKDESRAMQKLGRVLTNNDWEYRQRIIRLEKVLGITHDKEERPSATPKSIQSKNHVGLKKKPTHSPSPVTVAPAKPMPKPESVEWVNDHYWRLKITSRSFTQIINSETKQLLRISQGVEVPGCGLVVDIDVPSRKVTTQHCVITRRTPR